MEFFVYTTTTGRDTNNAHRTYITPNGLGRITPLFSAQQLKQYGILQLNTHTCQSDQYRITNLWDTQSTGNSTPTYPRSVTAARFCQ